MGHRTRCLVTLRDRPVLANSPPGPRAGRLGLAHTPVNHRSLRQAAGRGCVPAALCWEAAHAAVQGVLPFAAENACSARTPAGRGLLCAAGSTRRRERGSGVPARSGEPLLGPDSHFAASSAKSCVTVDRGCGHPPGPRVTDTGPGPGPSCQAHEVMRKCFWGNES